MTSTRVAVVVVVALLRMGGGESGLSQTVLNRFRVRSHLTMIIWLFSPLSTFMIQRLRFSTLPHLYVPHFGRKAPCA
jgi:hypothetical protein